MFVYSYVVRNTNTKERIRQNINKGAIRVNIALKMYLEIEQHHQGNHQFLLPCREFGSEFLLSRYSPLISVCVHGIAVFYRRRFRLVFGFISTAIDVFVLIGR